MDVYKRENSNKLWYWFRINGKLYRGSTGRPLSDTQGAKRVLAAEYEKHMNRKQFGQKPETTLREAFMRIIAQVTSTEQTRYSYELVMRKTLGLDKYADPAWFSLDADMPLSRLTDGDIEDLVIERRNAGYRNNSINIELRVIRRMHNASKKRFAANHDLTIAMLAHFEKTRFLSVEEEVGILAFLGQHKGSPSYDKAYALFIFLMDTGVRLQEGLNIAWSGINAMQHNMEVYRTKTKNLSVVPISDRVAALLKSKDNQAAPFEEMSRAVKLLRKAITETCNVNEKVNAQRGRATIHSCRDTYASRLASKGMSLHKIANLLGHTTTVMTRKYAQLSHNDVAEEARRMING